MAEEDRSRLHRRRGARGRIGLGRIGGFLVVDRQRYREVDREREREIDR